MLVARGDRNKTIGVIRMCFCAPIFTGSLSFSNTLHKKIKEIEISAESPHPLRHYTGKTVPSVKPRYIHISDIRTSLRGSSITSLIQYLVLGVGLSLLYIPTMAHVNHFFEKKRGLPMGS